MKGSDSITRISPAFLAAQETIGVATKASKNPFFHSTYADLGSVMEACKDALNKNGISVLQPVGTDEDGVYVETVLLHESGEYISSKMRLSVKEENNPQAQGSAITYARRYALQSMVFIPSEDDDGEGTMVRNQSKVSVNLDCVKCKKPISDKIYKYSTEVLGEALCMDCQKLTTKTSEPKEDVVKAAEKVFTEKELTEDLPF